MITIKLSQYQAEVLGIVVCENCGLPPNNHFTFGTRPCAHDQRCKAYKQKIRLPKDKK